LPLPLEPLAQGILPAQVIGTEHSGETVLKTPMGVVKLDLVLPNGQRLVMPPETTLQLRILAVQSAPLPAPLTGAEISEGIPAAIPELSRQWSTLEEATRLLQQQHPHLAQQLLSHAMPQPGVKMAKDIFLFMLGLKTGEIVEWLPKEALDALEKSGRSDLVRKLTAEHTTLQQFYGETGTKEWQAAFVPVYYQGEWHQNRFYVKRDPSASTTATDSTGTRFIMEVELSRLGALQLDGFVKKQPRHLQFDLVIRSTRPLAEETQQEIRRIFTDAAELTGFRGGLSFQPGHPFPTQPLEELLKPDRNVVA
jgi:hypothetical protein